MPIYKKALQELAKVGLCTAQEYTAVDKAIKPPCNLLVFGCGHDSPYWVERNEKGRTAFIENSQKWADMNKDKEVHLVQYGTRDLSKTDASIKLPPLVLPASITDEVWDVIYVDAPVGRTQGRMLSIMTAMELATDETTICVHDYDRESERVWTDHIAQLMGREVKVFGRMAVLEGKK